ncbi:PREDICTED: mitochondrial import receptor subunit TOM40-1-like isoform X1 [Camelina sativa]|uniref:Mitochondrial import receptor subunit TOM40-1-like isoform X1 n=1 Tax=Camelina sativa TaxID=90675 RepID=A0ABM0WUB8_CAMSA|nr:PREDICTED: mitochondrial import receptor subunit TOM40-1-like isoform X1 [Camelina sativa]
MADFVPPSMKEQADEKVDNSNLTCPVGYEYIDIEAYNILDRGYFRSLHLNYSPAFFDGNFCISSTMAPGTYYGLSAYYLNTKLTLTGGVTTDGRLTATVKYAITDKLTVRAYTNLRNESRLSITKVSLEYMALNYRARFKLGSNDLTAATYIQRVTPCLSLGGEVFCTNVPQESGVGYAARYETDKMVASAKVISNGKVSMTYVHK